MGDYRSNSYGNGGLQMERYYGGRSSAANPRDFRSYSASAYTSTYTAPPIQNKEMQFKKGTSVNGTSSKLSIFSDPEFQRKRRVASYKVYSVEGKVKGSFRKSFSWLKNRFYEWF